MALKIRCFITHVRTCVFRLGRGVLRSGLKFGVNIFTLINFVLTLKDCQWVTYAIHCRSDRGFTSYIGRQSSVLPYSQLCEPRRPIRSLNTRQALEGGWGKHNVDLRPKHMQIVLAAGFLQVSIQTDHVLSYTLHHPQSPEYSTAVVIELLMFYLYKTPLATSVILSARIIAPVSLFLKGHTQSVLIMFPRYCFLNQFSRQLEHTELQRAIEGKNHAMCRLSAMIAEYLIQKTHGCCCCCKKSYCELTDYMYALLHS